MVDRIQLILKVNNLTASRFADEIGVQRSSISHILSGRNMPSLDLIQKILKRFPEINSEWILNGSGSMMRNQQPDLFNIVDEVPDVDKKLQEIIENIEDKDPVKEDEIIEEQIVEQISPEPKAPVDVINEIVPDIKPEFLKEKGLTEEAQKSKPDRTIEKIVIFYNNKTFREYFPE
jgi:transcriptional regulator with XRE-family HTH domain